MATLLVYFEQRLVGSVDIDKRGPGFRYDPDWIVLRGSFPISLTMPLKSERIASDTSMAANSHAGASLNKSGASAAGSRRRERLGAIANLGRPGDPRWPILVSGRGGEPKAGQILHLRKPCNPT
jgi:hypothetical protein